MCVCTLGVGRLKKAIAHQCTLMCAMLEHVCMCITNVVVSLLVCLSHEGLRLSFPKNDPFSSPSQATLAAQEFPYLGQLYEVSDPVYFLFSFSLFLSLSLSLSFSLSLQVFLFLSLELSPTLLLFPFCRYECDPFSRRINVVCLGFGMPHRSRICKFRILITNRD